jgi:hypothetical protein
VKKRKLWIVAPVFNDWESAAELVDGIKSLDTDYFLKIMLVDDASTNYPIAYENLKRIRFTNKATSLQILMLQRNLGNQGAIVKGLREVFEKASEGDLFIVMDSDGEDRPADIPKLLKQISDFDIVVARRANKKKNLNLRFWHELFKISVRFLTGKTLDFGNFSALNFRAVSRLLADPKVNTSFVGTLLDSPFIINRVTLERGHRFHGQSKTNKDSLFIWGFLALSVHSEKIFVKLIRVSVIIGSLGLTASSLIIGIKIFTSKAIPGWSGLMLTLIASSLFQLLVILSGFVLIQTQIRNHDSQNHIERKGKS